MTTTKIPDWIKPERGDELIELAKRHGWETLSPDEAALAARVEQLRAALATYAQHKPFCAVNISAARVDGDSFGFPLAGAKRPCTCGLEQAVSRDREAGGSDPIPAVTEGKP